MLAVLMALRTLIATGVAFLVWYALVFSIAAPGTLWGVLLPVWIAGLVGGFMCAVFSARQGLIMAFTSGVLLTLGFLWFRHIYLDVGLGDNTFMSLWPMWFPAAFYVGAYLYLLVLVKTK